MIKLYKVIVVAEDAITRVGISHLIFWEKYGCTVVGNASDFEEMIQLIKLEEPELIFAEISGTSIGEIKLTEIMKTQCPNSELIIVGSNKDKFYIDKILKLGALDYIEKKYFVSKKLIEKLDYYSEILSKKNKDNKEISKDIIVAAQAQILTEILYGRRSEIELNHNILQLYGVSFPYNNFVVFMTRINNNKVNIENNRNGRFLEDIIETGGITYICNSSLNELSFIYNFRVTDQRNKETNVSNMGKRIFSIMKKYYQLDATIYISSFHKEVSNISLAYQQCCKVYKKKHRVSSSQFIYYDELKADITMKESQSFDTYVEKLDIAIKERDDVKIKYAISSFINELHKLNYIELSGLRYVLSAIIYRINVYIERIGCNWSEMWGEDIKPYVVIEELENKSDFIEFIQHIGERLVIIINSNTESNVYIKQMKDYVKKYYTEDFNIKEVATEIGLTTSYMSTLFKKSTGQTYKDYLINYRLLKAKELLSNTTESVATISRKVGYENENYFSKIFKIKVGVTPSQYRSKYYMLNNY
ncbi:helix-turn-helix domain-containing protein [Clostridium sp. DL1XJH146]